MLHALPALFPNAPSCALNPSYITTFTARSNPLSVRSLVRSLISFFKKLLFHRPSIGRSVGRSIGSVDRSMARQTDGRYVSRVKGANCTVPSPDPAQGH